jgi:long-subunit fatty acid transport protein
MSADLFFAARAPAFVTSRRMVDRTRRIGARAALAGAALAVLVLAPGRARAGAFEVMGVGPTGIAEAGARAARASDGSAAFFNPAGLGMGRGVHVEIAPQLGVSGLAAQGRGLAVADPFGFTIAADATVPFTGALEDRIRLGIAMYLPPSSLLRLLVEPPDTPQLPYFANRTQRLVVEPAIAVRIAQAASIGAGVNVLGGVAGPADVRPGASGAPEPRISVDATTRVSAHVGLRLDLTERIHLGATYRQEFSVPVFVATKADLGGISLSADVRIEQALFDPHTFVLGAAFDFDRLEIEVDAAYSAWSAYKGPALGVRAELPGALLTSEEPHALFRDVASLRAAASYGVDVGQRSEVLFRAGLGFEPTILASGSQGTFNFVDGPKVFAGLGATFALRDVLPRTVRFGAGFGLSAVLDSTIEKRACAALPCPAGAIAGPDPQNPSQGIENPGYPLLQGGGAFWSGSLGIGVDL